MPVSPRHPLHAAAYAAVVAVVILLPVVYIRGLDSFRIVKELVFVLAAIVLGALLLLAATWGAPLLSRRSPCLVPLLATLWTAVTLINATSLFRGAMSLVWVAAAGVIFLATYGVARERGLSLVWVMFLPAAANATLFVLQALSIWNPFLFPADTPRVARNIGLMGNSSFVGMYLLPIAVAALALVYARRKQRALPVAAAVLSGAALVATTALTAIAAYAAALVTLAILAVVWRHHPSRGRVAFSAAAVVAIVAVIFAGVAATYAPLRDRVRRIRTAAANGRFDMVLTGRTAAFLSAAAMFRDHPFLGVGAGHYIAHYYPYKIRIEEKYPSLLDSPMRGTNFAEAHNDHLQTLAVAGLPGYLLFLAALVLLARRSRRGEGEDDDDDERRRFGRALAAPLAVSFAVAAMGHFPLELAASLGAFLHLAAICYAWTENDALPA